METIQQIIDRIDNEFYLTQGYRQSNAEPISFSERVAKEYAKQVMEYTLQKAAAHEKNKIIWSHGYNDGTYPLSQKTILSLQEEIIKQLEL